MEIIIKGEQGEGKSKIVQKIVKEEEFLEISQAESLEMKKKLIHLARKDFTFSLRLPYHEFSTEVKLPKNIIIVTQ